MEPITQPLTIDEVRDNIGDGTKLTVVVKVSLGDLIDRSLESINNFIEGLILPPDADALMSPTLERWRQAKLVRSRTLKTTTRFIPEGYTLHKQVGDAVVYYSNPLLARGWRSAKQVNPDFRHRFRDEFERDQFVTKWFEQLARRAADKTERKAKRVAINNQPNPFKAGDILNYSWGYNQTNQEFYQVLDVKPRSVVVREIIHKDVKATGDMTAMVMPCPGQWADRSEEMTKVVKFNSRGAYLTMDHGIAEPWDGKPAHETRYG